MGTWNVRGINGIANREEVVDIFRNGKFEFFVLTETKLKINGEVSCCEMNGIIVGVQEIDDGEWYSAVIGFGCVSSRILWVKFKFSRVKV